MEKCDIERFEGILLEMRGQNKALVAELEKTRLIMNRINENITGAIWGERFGIMLFVALLIFAIGGDLKRSIN